jgi:hypothetical protein
MNDESACIFFVLFLNQFNSISMKLKFYVIIISAAALFLTVSDANAQGCVAVKNMSSCPLSYDSLSSGKGLQLSLNYRYFRSYKHFVGNHEETHRVKEGTQVINNDNSVNFGATYSINPRFSASVIIPYIFIDRSSMYEHLGNSSGQRFHTQSTGLGDVRLIAYYNAVPANKLMALNVGLGLKLPTGKYDATDFFHKNISPQGEPVVVDLREGVVDQSIQRGDGGLGTIVEADLVFNPKGKFGAYVNGMYMFNPRNTNGIERGPNLTKNSSGQDIALSNEFSVTDQYMIRAGAKYVNKGFHVQLGGRMECIPSKDLIGDSDGFRRPGYIVSAEPSAFYTFGKNTIGFSFPIAIERNRTRSQIDIARGTNPQTGKPYHGDAAFANWLLSISYAHRISL